MKTIFIAILMLGHLAWPGQSSQKVSNEEIYSANLDSAMFHCYNMIKLGLVDSLITECRMDATNPDCMFSLAVGFTAKGKRDSAQIYLLKRFNNELTQLGSGVNPYDILNHYFISYALSSDKGIFDKMEKLFKTHYEMLGYPQPSVGLELYKLAHLDQKIRYEGYYWEDQCTSEQCRKELLDKYYIQDTVIQQRLFQMVARNGGLFSEKLVGPAAALQYIILYHVSNIQYREKMVEPWIKKAATDGETDATVYADAVVRTAQIRGMPEHYLDSLKMSLYKAAGVELHISR